MYLVHGPQQSLKVNLTDLGGTMGVKMYPVLPGDMQKYPIHDITSSLEWQPKRHQDCDEPPPKRPCNREIAQEYINNTFLLKWQQILASASKVNTDPPLVDNGATENVIRAQTVTDVLHTINDDTSSSDFSSSDESSMGSMPGLQERNMQN